MYSHWFSERQASNVQFVALRVHAGKDAATVLDLPVVTKSDGDGPTLLLTAGVHGDEYEGPFALGRLIRRLGELNVQGRLMIAPVLNPPAMEAGTRCGPADQLDLNRCFPGRKDGSISERIAAAVSEHLVPQADVVIDLHTGGIASTWIPCAMIHRVADSAVFDRAVRLLNGICVPAAVIIDESDKQGMLDSHVEGLGKVFVCCEFGGGLPSPETIDVAFRTVKNILHSLGMVDGDQRVPMWRGRADTRRLEVPDLSYAFHAPVHGLFEPRVEVGDRVFAGQSLGLLHPAENAIGEAEAIVSPKDGVLLWRRTLPPVRKGARLGMVARDWGECLSEFRRAREPT